ncbi:MAG: OmpA family protein [Thermodesulfobacteriota bacterium]
MHPAPARRNRDEGEKPFWISYSDLMTALMVLFLVVMSVSLLIITRELLKRQESLEAVKVEMDALKERRETRAKAIQGVMIALDEVVHKDFTGQIRIIHDRHAIDFGERARFAHNDHHLSADGGQLLRDFVPHLLAVVDTREARLWFRRVVVEGFTDTDGSYLYNLNLSLKRAQSVVCALMEDGGPQAPGLTPDQKRRVIDLFLVGGFSFNSARASKEESRRIELRLEFQGLEEESGWQEAERSPFPLEKIGKCQLD